MRATPRKYSCMKCGGSVSKPPCVAVSDKQKKEGAKVIYVGLHGWRCEGQCGGPCKVKVTLEVA